MPGRLLRYGARHWSALLLAGVVVLFFGPLLFRQQVLYPHDNAHELGLVEASDAGTLTTRGYSDQSLTYIPELHHNLHGEGSGWLSTWNPHVEMGRPSFQFFGLGRAFFLTRIVGWFENDAFRNYTLCAVLALVLSVFFGYRLLDSLGLCRTAATAGALALGLGLKPASNLLFIVFLWGMCWTIALLWLVTALFKRPTLGRYFGLALCMHCLLVSAYPQQVVWTGYLLTAYVLLSVFRHPGGVRSGVRIVGGMAVAVAIGGLSALPLYLDLFVQTGLSSRENVHPEFFLQALPGLESWKDAASLYTTIFDPFWLGNIVSPEYPAWAGFPVTPVIALCALPALARGSWRRFWPILVFGLVCVGLTFWHDFYRLGLAYGGLSISRFVPLNFLHIPLVVLAAYGIDRVLREEGPRPWPETIAGLFLTGLAGIAVLVAGFEPRTLWVGVGVLFALGTLGFLWTRTPLLLIVLVLASTFHYGYRTQIRRPREVIRETSPLVEAIREHTSDGTRYAWVRHGLGFKTEGGRIRLIGPNSEGLLGLRSVHTYNSLSSRAYQSWASKLNTQEMPRSNGRRFSDIKRLASLTRDEFRLTGVRVVLSPQQLDLPGASLVETVGEMHLYELPLPPLLEAQFQSFEREEPDKVTLSDLGDGDRHAITRRVNLDDRLVFDTTPVEHETVLFVSQQYHPLWSATGATSDGKRLETVRVNQLYQGVLVPPGTAEVELRFRPSVRWMWIPQALLAAAAVLLLVRRLRRVSA